MERIVIYRLGSLGDTIAALPCFHLIERSFPNAERLVLTNVPVSRKAAPLEVILREGGFIHGAIPYPVGLRSPVALARLAGRLRRLNASTLVFLAASKGSVAATKRDVAFFRVCGFRRIIGAPLSEELQFNREDASGVVERESARLARCMAALGTIDLTDRGLWDLRLTDDERAAGAAALGVLEREPFLAVNTGGKAAEKDWGEPRWAELLSAFSASRPGLGVVFVGAPDDSERASTLGAAWSGGPVVDLCGKLSPRESAAALAHAEVFIGHDSGPLHLADAVNTPAVGLFGDYNRPEMWHPSGDRTRVIHRMDGLDTIQVDDVLQLALDLSRRQPQA